MNLEKVFLDLEGHFCTVYQKVRGPWPLWHPGSYVPGVSFLFTSCSYLKTIQLQF